MCTLYRILNHFNTSSDEYAVVFVSNCTAGVKLVAESFQFFEPLSQSRSGVRHTTTAADFLCERKAGDFEEFPRKCQRDGEFLSQKSVEDRHNLLVASAAVSDAEFETRISSNSSDVDDIDDNSGDCDVVQHSELSINSCEWNSEPISKPTFLYLDDNHTSVIGMRGIVTCRGADFCYIQADKMDTFLSSVRQSDVGCWSQEQPQYKVNCLFAYPAQSNFSGHRYPLEWVDMIHCQSEHEPRTHPPCDCRTRPHWYVLLDAAALLTTSQLDLSRHNPDFVVLSFYKMFGFPTGLGMLVVCVIFNVSELMMLTDLNDLLFPFKQLLSYNSVLS